MVLSLRFSGTSPLTIRWANPSAIAVLPTPGSPTNIGLFLVRRERIWSTRRISSSRPMTGSSLPLWANWVRFLAYLLRELYVSSAEAEVTRSPLRSSAITCSNCFSVTPCSFKVWPTWFLILKIAKSKCSIETYSSFIFLAILLASINTSPAVRERDICPPCTLG